MNKKSIVDKKSIGTHYEQMACNYLKEKDVLVLEKNFRCRQGEIDLIGYDKEYLVFVEVKYRATKRMGAAAEAVTAGKQRKICRAADYYRYLRCIGDDRPIRYDVIAIQKNKAGCDSIEWYRNAFNHIF